MSGLAWGVIDFLAFFTAWFIIPLAAAGGMLHPITIGVGFAFYSAERYLASKRDPWHHWSGCR